MLVYSTKYIMAKMTYLLKPRGLYFDVKGTVSVISSNSPCKDGNARFTTIPLKHLSGQYCGIYCLFPGGLNCLIFIMFFPQ